MLQKLSKAILLQDQIIELQQQKIEILEQFVAEQNREIDRLNMAIKLNNTYNK